MGSTFYKVDNEKGSITLHVTVKPNSKDQSLRLDRDQIIITIKSPPTKGKANKELIEYLAKLLSVKKSDISVIKGHKSRDKTLSITNSSIEKISQLINS